MHSKYDAMYLCIYWIKQKAFNQLSLDLFEYSFIVILTIFYSITLIQIRTKNLQIGSDHFMDIEKNNIECIQKFILNVFKLYRFE